MDSVVFGSTYFSIWLIVLAYYSSFLLDLSTIFAFELMVHNIFPRSLEDIDLIFRWKKAGHKHYPISVKLPLALEHLGIQSKQF